MAALIALALASGANAHGPSTSIGRAVEALRAVGVSYETGAAVSDVEAGSFPPIVDSNPKVAFMAASAATELAGGPNAIAAEIAREARLTGTLVVLVGTRLGVWSDEIADDRLAELVRRATSEGGGSSGADVEALVRGVQAESDDDAAWGWIAAAIALVALGTLVLADRLSRRRVSPRAPA